MLSLSDVLIGAVPGIAWLFWIRRKDDKEPEPLLLVLGVFLLGALGALVIGYLRPRLEGRILGTSAGMHEVLLDAYFVTAIPEEFVKFLAFAFGALWSKEWDEPLDGIVYGAAAGLGFASIENAYFLAVTGEDSVVLWRGFTSTLAHVAFSSGFGFFVGLSRLRQLRPTAGLLFGAMYAILLHGTYDFLLMARRSPQIALLCALPILLLLLSIKIRWARARSKARPT